MNTVHTPYLSLLVLHILAVNTAIRRVALYETFTTPVCKSPLTESRAPYWMIDGEVLGNISVNSRYGAEVARPTDDSRGRHQAQLIIHTVNEMLDGSNISCAVGSELRMVIILYIVPGMYVCMYAKHVKNVFSLYEKLITSPVAHNLPQFDV